MARPRANHAEIRMGAFTLCGIVALVVAILGGPMLFSEETFIVHVEFPFSTGVSGLKPGSPVYLGGLQVGHVNRLELRAPDADGVEVVDAELAMLPTLRVPRTATIQIARSLTSNKTTLVIALPRETDSAHLGKGDTLELSPLSSPLETLLGTSRAHAVEAAVSRLQAKPFAVDYRDLTERFSTLADQTRLAAAEVRADWTTWSPQMQAITAARDSATNKLHALTGLFGEGQPLDATRLSVVLERAKANWDTSSELLSTIRTRVDDQVIPPLTDLIDRIKRSIAIMEEDVARIGAISTDTADAIDRSRADLALAGDQIRRIMSEVTLMPWTLLGGVLEDKGEAAQFQKFAREIVRSAAELHMAVIMAQTLLETDPQLAHRHPELVALLKKWIDEASTEHEAAGTMLLNQLIGPPTP